MRAHDSPRGMRTRSQQQVPNFVRHHIRQECMSKPSPLGKFLNAVIEDVCKVTASLLIRISRTEHIDAITNFRIHRTRTDLKSQMGGIREITAPWFDFLKFRRTV